MKVKRLAQMSELERAVVMMVWSDVKDLPDINIWRKYERGFTHDDKKYRYKCLFKIEEGHLRLDQAKINVERGSLCWHFPAKRGIWSVCSHGVD